MNEEMKAKRDGLKALSRPLQQLVKSGALPSVNEGLKAIYASEGHTELNTFRQWFKEGKCVKKGEKALLLWGQPRGAANKAKDAETDDDEFSFFPLAYVFSQLQVQPLTTKAN